MRKPMDIDFERCTSGIEFEEWVKELLGQLRMKAERVVKNDCGIDIIAIAVRHNMNDGAVSMTLNRIRLKLHNYLLERGFEL